MATGGFPPCACSPPRIASNAVAGYIRLDRLHVRHPATEQLAIGLRRGLAKLRLAPAITGQPTHPPEDDAVLHRLDMEGSWTSAPRRSPAVQQKGVLLSGREACG